MDSDVVIAAVYAAMFALGVPFALWRYARDIERRGQLNLHDGTLLRPPTSTPPARQHMQTHVARTGGGHRLSIGGLAIARLLGFTLQGRTRRVSEQLTSRLIVEGTKGSARAKRLFARGDVNDAIAALCGGAGGFNRVDLYPEGELALTMEGAGRDVDDVLERLLRLAEVLERAAPAIDDDDVDLGSTSGSTSSAAFSIEIRS